MQLVSDANRRRSGSHRDRGVSGNEAPGALRGDRSRPGESRFCRCLEQLRLCARRISRVHPVFRPGQLARVARHDAIAARAAIGARANGPRADCRLRGWNRYRQTARDRRGGCSGAQFAVLPFTSGLFAPKTSFCPLSSRWDIARRRTATCRRKLRATWRAASTDFSPIFPPSACAPGMATFPPSTPNTSRSPRPVSPETDCKADSYCPACPAAANNCRNWTPARTLGIFCRRPARHFPHSRARSPPDRARRVL